MKDSTSPPKGGSTDHPAPEELLSYRDGTLPSEPADRLREHFLICSECTRAYLDLLGFRPQADDDLAPAWRAMQARLAALEEGTPETGEPWWEGSPLSSAPRLALATTVLVALLGAAAFYASHLFVKLRTAERQLAEYERPQTNLATAYLLPEGSVRSDGSSSSVALPAGARFLYLRLILLEPSEYDRLALDIFDGQGRLIDRLSGLSVGENGHVLLALPAGLLPEGEYRLKLSGDSGEQRAVAEYKLRFQR